jgi:formylglycine-generating enzyme required for sulfatase activity
MAPKNHEGALGQSPVFRSLQEVCRDCHRCRRQAGFHHRYFCYGLYAADCTPVVEWLMQAQPEVAAQCILRSGAQLPDASLLRLRQAWRSRLTNIIDDPQPEARAAIGRALGSLTLDGRPLDDRPGVGLRFDGRAPMPGAGYRLGRSPGRGLSLWRRAEEDQLPAFHIARYPVTNCQFRCFIDDPQGYADDRWWEGLAERTERPAESAWDHANHPRETVSWFEAMAFCRWLSQMLGYEVRLPSEQEWENGEQEWEKAARGADGREFPWGDFEPGHANIDETSGHDGPHYLAQTSAAGIYPQGASPWGCHDMAGNVWEWCLNKYEKSSDTDPGEDAWRVVRGGSWVGYRHYARCASASLVRSRRPQKQSRLSGVVCFPHPLKRWPPLR